MEIGSTISHYRVEERDWRVQYLASWGTLSTVLRGDPRWDTLLGRIGIPDVVAPIQPLEVHTGRS